jgi:predicted dehydrogenase
MGCRHLAGYGLLREAGQRSFQIAAVCDPNARAADAAARLAEELFGSRPASFRSAGDLIASSTVQALDIATDPRTHHIVAVPALREGLHVLCEKPLGLTVRACRAIIDAAAQSGAVLATAENYRRDGPNRLARAVLDSRMLGDILLMLETNIGGDGRVLVSPWRHIREAGSIAVDMGVHYTDIFNYLLGPIDRASGKAFIAEPYRVLPDGAQRVPGIDEVSPGVMRATGDDSLVAIYETSAGALIQLSYVPAGRGRACAQRNIYGRDGSMSIPRDRTGGPVVVSLGQRTLSSDELFHELGGFELHGIAATLFGSYGTEYNLPFESVDAAIIAIEIDDFLGAIAEHRPPEVDGVGGLLAVAAVWAVAESHCQDGWVRIADVVDGAISRAQDAIDDAIGLRRAHEREMPK